MADFECRQFEIRLEFVRWSFAERNNFSKGSSELKKNAQVIQVWGGSPTSFFYSNCFWIVSKLGYFLLKHAKSANKFMQCSHL